MFDKHISNQHLLGFENIQELSRLWMHPEIRERLYMHADFMAVARVLRPELCDHAYVDRPCRRTLRYISNDGDGEFSYGALYHSVTFNGATYVIEGREGRIGCAHFEVVAYQV